MSFLFSHKDKDGYRLLVLFLEKEISVFIVKITQGKAEQIVYKNVRHTLSIRDGITAEKRDKLKLVLAKLFTIVHTETARVLGKKEFRLDGACCVFSYPWFFADEIHVNLVGEDISVDERSVVEMIEQAFTESEGKKAEPFQPMLLEHSVNQIKLNGYLVSDPYHKKTDRIDIAATTISIFPEIEQITEVEIGAFFRSGRPMFGSLARVFSAMPPSAYIIMDSSNTLVIDVKPDHSYQVKGINIGMEEIVKAAVEVFGAESQESALSYLKMAKEDVLASNISVAVIQSVKEKMVDWTFLVKNALDEFDQEPHETAVTIVYRRGLKSFTENFIKDELPIKYSVQLMELETIVAESPCHSNQF